jgi:hypothetical protein
MVAAQQRSMMAVFLIYLEVITCFSVLDPAVPAIPALRFQARLRMN